MALSAPCRDLSVPFGCDEEVIERFRLDGYVVVTGVLSEDEVGRCVDELWESPRLLGRSEAVRRDDPSTWGGENWPQQDGGRNFLDSADKFEDAAGWELHQHPRVVYLFRLLYGGPVFSRGDWRFGVMRPTAGAGRAAWRTDASWLHWDQSPWREPDFLRVQAFVCLSDQTTTSGGLLCVPGFHHRWEDWGREHPEGSVVVDGRVITGEYGQGNPFPVPEDDPAQKEVVRVLAPAGSVVFWDGRLPHQNYPNTGTEFRIVHYLDFVPMDEDEMEERRRLLARKLAVRHVAGGRAAAAAAGSRRVFPGGLSDLGREVLCVPQLEEEDSDMDPALSQAIALTLEAGEAELRGDLQGSVEKLRRAGKVWPDIEDWHEAIFGN